MKKNHADGLSIAFDVDSTKMQRQLRAIAKHTEALADELSRIEEEVCANCGSTNVDVVRANGDARDIVDITINCYNCNDIRFRSEPCG